MLSFQTRQEPLVYNCKAMIVSPFGMIDKKNVIQFESQLQDYLSVGFQHVVLDLKQITGINSTGMQVLLKMVESYQNAGGILLLLNVPAGVGKLFDMVGLSPIFTSFTDSDDAISYLTEQIQKVQKETPPDRDAMVRQVQPTRPIPLPGTDKISKSPPKVKKVKSQQATSPSAGTPVSSGSTSQKIYTEGLKMEMEYPKKCQTFCQSSFQLHMFPIQSNVPVKITPAFPGCLVVPYSETVYLYRETPLEFSVTPLARGKLKGWIEFSQEGKRVCKLPLKIKAVSSWWPFLFFFLGLFFPLIATSNPHINGWITSFTKGMGLPIPGSVLIGLGLVITSIALFIWQSIGFRQKSIYQLPLKKMTF